MDRDIFEGMGCSSRRMYIRCIANITKLSEIVPPMKIKIPLNRSIQYPEDLDIYCHISYDN